MTKTVLSIIIAATAAFAACSPSKDDLRSSIFRVENERGNGWGTAFAVTYGDKNFLVTNAHVCDISDNDKMYADVGGGRVEVPIIAKSKSHDLCLIGAFSGVEPLEISERNELESGEEVYTAGFPAMPYMYMASGEYQGVLDLPMGEPLTTPEECTSKGGTVATAIFFQVCVTVKPFIMTHMISDGGSSGSPIFDQNGEVVGVLSIGVGRIGFIGGVPVEYLKELLKEAYLKDEGIRALK